MAAPASVIRVGANARMNQVSSAAVGAARIGISMTHHGARPSPPIHACQRCSGISPNVLSDRLKRLEAEGLVLRSYFKELPPRVEYTLTDKGWAVRPILLSMLDWGRTYVEPITEEMVGNTVTHDFAMRVLPTFSF